MVYTTDSGNTKSDLAKNGEPVLVTLVPMETSLHMGTEAAPNGVNGSSKAHTKEKTAEVDNNKATEIDYGLGDELNKPPVPVKDQIKDCCKGCFSLDTLKKRFPIIGWLPKYNLFSLQCDIIAGITVGLTLIPQSLAFAGIAGLPPQYGLYSGFICTFVYTLMGSAKDITIGPSAITSLLTASFATTVSPTLPNGEKDPTLPILLAFTTGLVFIAMSFLKLGIIVSYISLPVINAFSSAAAITIAVSQIKSLLGLKGIPNDFIDSVIDICRKLYLTNVWDLTMGLACIVSVVLLKKLREIKWKNDPDNPPNMGIAFLRKCIFISGASSTAIVVILAAIIFYILEVNGIHGITPTGKIKPGMPDFQAPKFEINIGNMTMTSSEVFGKLGAGIGIVPIICLLEAMSVGKYFARVNKYKLDPTQELLAYGIGNLLTSFFQGFTITGTFSRTAINAQCGVKTQLGCVLTGTLVIISLFFLTPLFYYIPKCALAAVIIAAVLAMVDFTTIKMIYKANKLELLPYAITFICTLAIGIQWGIFVGVGISFFFLLYPLSRPKLLFSSQQGFFIVTPTHGLTFPGAEFLEIKALDNALNVEKPHIVILNMEHISNIDFSAAQSLRSLIVECEFHGMKLILAQAQKRVRRQLKLAKLPNLVLVKTTQDAIDKFSYPSKDFHEFDVPPPPHQDAGEEGLIMSRL
ncbi:sodium-independent sulfate anion transporter-like [Physella acuta]|uniref:sodium-independent sulfate anion transporter-like n=1 Tax=Physella acuta TaxID=109671 RepID=UPI0027DAC909|nr:sodium-independent sulfate anion transporter-like [Physella acuta]